MKLTIKRKTIISLVLIILLLSTVFACMSTDMNIAYAESITYSDVMVDLEKDESFSSAYYPVVADDNSLSVVQIAESVNGELFVYVYQPSGLNKDLRASKINISTTINDFINFHVYNLDFINSSETLYKYKVENFDVKSDETRYYVITSIYRAFDESIDNQADFGNTIDFVNYAVNRQYCFGKLNGADYVNVVDIETIEITDKFVGFARYNGGFHLYGGQGLCDSHFVAFDTDKPIDKLLEADVYYAQQSYFKTTTLAGITERLGEIEEKHVHLKYSDEVEYTGTGICAGTYEWNRIETVDEFLAEHDLTQNVYSGIILDVEAEYIVSDAEKTALENKEWVLRFAETAYLAGGTGMNPTVNSTRVGDVSILRLKFETDGVVYNLGTIDNMQTGEVDQNGNPVPFGGENFDTKVKQDYRWIFFLIAIILLMIVCAPILPYIIKFVLWIILMPFKLIGEMNKSIKKTNSKTKRKEN